VSLQPQGRRVLHDQGDRGDGHQGSEARPTNRMGPTRTFSETGGWSRGRNHRWFLRGLRRGHRWFLRGLRRGRRWFLRGHRWVLRWFLGRLRRGHRWCLRGFGGVTLWCLLGLRPGCDHGRPATGVLRLTPRPGRNAGPGRTVARGSLLGPAAILLRRRAGRRSRWVKQRGLGHLLRGIAALAEREPGHLLRGIAATGAGEQPDQDRHGANHDRRYPRDPHGHQAGHPGFGRALHDDRSVVATSHFGVGGSLPRGGADAYPSRAPASPNAPRPELEG
jgi:hypothetical protein